MISEVDVNSDNKIDFNEFKRMIKLIYAGLKSEVWPLAPAQRERELYELERLTLTMSSQSCTYKFVHLSQIFCLHTALYKTYGHLHVTEAELLLERLQEAELWGFVLSDFPNFPDFFNFFLHFFFNEDGFLREIGVLLVAENEDLHSVWLHCYVVQDIIEDISCLNVAVPK